MQNNWENITEMGQYPLSQTGLLKLSFGYK